MSLSQRIEDKQKKIAGLRDKLTEHMKSVDDDNPTAETMAVTDELSKQIELHEKDLEGLKRAEQHLAASAADAEQKGTNGVELPARRPFAIAAKKVQPIDYLWRALYIGAKAHLDKSRKPVLDLIRDTYGEDEPTRVIAERFVTRAASLPASTTTSHWASDLVQTVTGAFIESLMPYSIYPRLASMGSSFTFGANGVISLPFRTTATAVGGAFVAQGAAIPVKQGAFNSMTLTPKKMGVIVALTREITEHSVPSAEAIIRQAVLEDTAIALDTILMDNTAADTTRPAGLQNLAGSALAVTTGTAGSLATFLGDVKVMLADLVTNTNGNMRKPVWIINPGDVPLISLLQTTNGDTPFKDEISRNMLMGYPVIVSSTGTADTWYLLDAADFMTATGDTPRFDVSDQAVLHMEDTSPTAIGTVGTPNVVAAPVRSLWQTDSLAIRMLLDVNWALRHAGTVSWQTGMIWRD